MRKRIMKRKRLAAVLATKPDRPFLDAEMDDMGDSSPAPYVYRVVGSASSHPNERSGSIFREEFQDDPQRVIFDSNIPVGATHKHQHSTSSSSAYPEAQGLLKHMDGGETSGPRFADDVMTSYDEQQLRYASGPSGGSADEEGRINRQSRATTLSEYPPTPTSRNVLLPPGAAPPTTPPAIIQAQQEHDLARDFGMTMQEQGQRAVTPPAPPMSPSPIGKSPQPLVPLNPD